ncbi:MAG: hypothetical protein NTW17_01540 [Candidatus Pacearchaeota archaeon]|nr:hypothetical protein [Candidatus Pacearchaeota archaeon]
MRVIGFNFDKISIERFKDKVEGLKITTNIDISEIKEIKSEILKTKEELVQVKFFYVVNYEPEFAKVDLKGTVLISIEEKQAKEILKEWKKKKLPEDFRMPLFNIILRKATTKSLNLEDEMNLPLHIPLPSLKPKEK